MKRPNFFLIGASKSGTSSLYHYLIQHPDIFMCPEKEPSHFLFPKGLPIPEIQEGLFTPSFSRKMTHSPRVFPTRPEYLRLFENVNDEKIIGEASTDYLIDPDTPQALFEFAPQAKIMAILRNPFDAAYSEFLMNQRDGELRKETTFLEVLRAEDIGKNNLWSIPRYIRTRMHHTQVRRYLDIFLKEQTHFFLFDDLTNTEKLLKETFDFLEVSSDVNIDFSQHYNVTNIKNFNSTLDSLANGLPTLLKKSLQKVFPTSFHTWYQYGNRKIHHAKSEPVKCPDEAKEYLLPIFTPVIRELEHLIDRDLTLWLK